MPLDMTNWPAADVDDTTALLIRARGFIERGWCREASARDLNGYKVPARSSGAVSWCAFGALIAAGLPTHDTAHPAYLKLVYAVKALGGSDIADFNDRQETVEPILAAFDRAIAAGNTDVR